MAYFQEKPCIRNHKNAHIVRVAAKLYNFVINMETECLLKNETILGNDFVDALPVAEVNYDKNGNPHGVRRYLETREEEEDMEEKIDLTYHDKFDPSWRNYMHHEDPW